MEKNLFCEEGLERDEWWNVEAVSECKLVCDSREKISASFAEAIILINLSSNKQI